MPVSDDPRRPGCFDRRTNENLAADCRVPLELVAASRANAAKSKKVGDPRPVRFPRSEDAKREAPARRRIIAALPLPELFPNRGKFSSAQTLSPKPPFRVLAEFLQRATAFRKRAHNRDNFTAPSNRFLFPHRFHRNR